LRYYGEPKRPLRVSKERPQVDADRGMLRGFRSHARDIRHCS